MAAKQAALGSKGESKPSLHPTPDFSPVFSELSQCRAWWNQMQEEQKGQEPAQVAVEAASEACIPSSPYSSYIALSLQAATTGSSSNEGSSLLEATAPLSEGMETEETQRKHCGASVYSVKTHNQSRPTASSSGVASGAESIELDEITAGEVVDLTGDSAESMVVDLTHNDSVTMVEESRQWQNSELKSQQLLDSLILSSDDESELKESNAFVASRWHGDFVKGRFSGSKPSGSVSCPICLDGYSEIVSSGRLTVSTKCCHIFCSRCLRNSLSKTSFCPNLSEEAQSQAVSPSLYMKTSVCLRII